MNTDTCLVLYRFVLQLRFCPDILPNRSTLYVPREHLARLLILSLHGKQSLSDAWGDLGCETVHAQFPPPYFPWRSSLLTELFPRLACYAIRLLVVDT